MSRFFSDITELKEHQHQLERMAHYDALTGIPNRVLLADRLEQAIAQSQRHKRNLAVVYLDLDGFKEVNDLHGHETGDLLLIAIAQRLRDTLREGDTLARLGGDEFVAVLTDLGEHEEWMGILSRMQQAAAHTGQDPAAHVATVRQPRRDPLSGKRRRRRHAPPPR